MYANSSVSACDSIIEINFHSTLCDSYDETNKKELRIVQKQWEKCFAAAELLSLEQFQSMYEMTARILLYTYYGIFDVVDPCYSAFSTFLLCPRFSRLIRIHNSRLFCRLSLSNFIAFLYIWKSNYC